MTAQEAEQDDDIPFDLPEAFEGDPDALTQGNHGEEEEWTGFSAADGEQPEEDAEEEAIHVDEAEQGTEPITPEEAAAAAVASTSKVKSKKGKAKSTVVAPVLQADAYDTPFDGETTVN